MPMLLAKNRKALHEFSILEKYIAGVELYGYEVKAIREGKASFEGAFIELREGEVWLKNMYIGRYSKQSNDVTESDTRRPRKLLLNSQEIFEISKQLKEKGKTAIPLALILQNNLIKLEMSVVKGKKEFEKKEVAKERQIKRDLELEVRSYKNEVGRK